MDPDASATSSVPLGEVISSSRGPTFSLPNRSSCYLQGGSDRQEVTYAHSRAQSLGHRSPSSYRPGAREGREAASSRTRGVRQKQNGSRTKRFPMKTSKQTCKKRPKAHAVKNGCFRGGFPESGGEGIWLSPPRPWLFQILSSRGSAGGTAPRVRLSAQRDPASLPLARLRPARSPSVQ